MDNKKLIGHPDRDLVALKQAYERRDWAKSRGITVEILDSIINRIGTHSAKALDTEVARMRAAGEIPYRTLLSRATVQDPAKATLFSKVITARKRTLLD